MKHRITAKQSEAIGHDLMPSEVEKAREIFLKYEKTEPDLDASGNLRFGGKLYSPKGKNITGLGVI